LFLAPFDDYPNIIAGKDVEAKGTWLGINFENKKIAFLTNRKTENKM